MLRTFFRLADKREQGRVAVAWLLGGVVFLALSGYSPVWAEQSGSNQAAGDIFKQREMERRKMVRVFALTRAACEALDRKDWDAVVSNARGALKLDPDNTSAKELKWTGLTAPLPEEREGDFQYKVVEGNVVITDYDNRAAAQVRIPARIAGKAVVRIGGLAFKFNRSVTGVTISDSVASIGMAAFANCKSLSTITIGDSMTCIDPIAFIGCENLTSISVSRGNTSFRSIDGVLFSKDATTIVKFPAGKEQTEYTIPESVTRIGERAFLGCKRLTDVTIGDSVEIGTDAFKDCPWQPAGK